MPEGGPLGPAPDPQRARPRRQWSHPHGVPRRQWVQHYGSDCDIVGEWELTKVRAQHNLRTSGCFCAFVGVFSRTSHVCSKHALGEAVAPRVGHCKLLPRRRERPGERTSKRPAHVLPTAPTSIGLHVQDAPPPMLRRAPRDMGLSSLGGGARTAAPRPATALPCALGATWTTPVLRAQGVKGTQKRAC